MKSKTLTKAEEQLMQLLWQVQKGFLKDIVEQFPEPKPHANTVATLLKILLEKGFVNYTVYGRQHEYFPVISREMYSRKSLKNVVSNYFGGSYKNAVSFLVEKDELQVEDLETLLAELKNKK